MRRPTLESGKLIQRIYDTVNIGIAHLRMAGYGQAFPGMPFGYLKTQHIPADIPAWRLVMYRYRVMYQRRNTAFPEIFSKAFTLAAQHHE